MLLELLKAMSLEHPTPEDSPESSHGALSQLVGLAPIIIDPLEGLVEAPDRHAGVDGAVDGPDLCVARVLGEEASCGTLKPEELSLNYFEQNIYE